MAEESSNIPAQEYADRYGFTEAAIVHRIQSRILDGFEENGAWFVRTRSNPSSSPTSAHDRVAHQSAATSIENRSSSQHEPKPDSIQVESQVFLWCLVGVLSALALVNVLNLIAGVFSSLGPLSFQAVILMLLQQKHPNSVKLIRVWAFLLVVGGFLSGLAILLRIADYGMFASTEALGEVTIGSVLYVVFCFSAGIPFFTLTKRYIRPIISAEARSVTVES